MYSKLASTTYTLRYASVRRLQSAGEAETGPVGYIRATLWT